MASTSVSSLLDRLNAIPKADTEFPSVRLYIAVVWHSLARFGWAAALEAEIHLVQRECPSSSDGANKDLATAALTNIAIDLAREVKRFHSGSGSTRFTPLGGQTAASSAKFPATPWCFERSAAPTDTSASFEEAIEAREQSKCCITGAFSKPTPDAPCGPLDAAHIFPFGLAAYVTRLSRLMYPHEIFRLLRAGGNIDNPNNGLLMHQGVHNLSFGVLWWIEHDGRTYRINRPGPVMMVPDDQAILKFNDPSPHPIFINFHACMARIRRELTALDLWKAAGERDEWFDEDDAERQPVRSGTDGLSFRDVTVGEQSISPSSEMFWETESAEPEEMPPFVL
ncbi:hypothetical protein HDU88_000003 [Geranomyces variabilis]|nr:hypothetical protein HDU88_000003 [Geranomyces variabilis]